MAKILELQKKDKYNKERTVGSIEIKNQTETTADLCFFGDINSESLGEWQKYYPEDKAPKDVQDFLDQLEGVSKINVHINSGGGSVFGGIAIYNIDEEAEFPDVSTPQFGKVDYKVKKKGGILKITQELLDDTAENIISYLKKWIAKKAKATRNFLIVAKIREITADAEVAVDSLDDLKKIFNILLDPAIALTAGVVTNQDGYNWLDSLKDKDGKYILQPDSTKPTSTLLFGKYPIKKVGNRTMPSKTTDGGYKVPIVCGDLKEAITIFDRETLTIDISSSAGKLWETDQTGIKVRERLDIKAIDEEAIVMAEHTIKTTTDVQQTAAQSAAEETKTYTQAEIEKMSRENIIALGTKLGYTMTTTASDEKSAVVADFMAQQTAAQNK